MKKFIMSLLLFTTAFSPQSEAYGGWIAPTIIGGLFGYQLAHPYYYTPVPVYINQPVYVPPAYIPPVYPNVYPYGYHYVTLWDNFCYCYKTLLVPNP